MPTVITATEYLSFDTVVSPSIIAIPLNTPAWEVLDYGPMYEIGNIVGEDRVVPGTTGRIAVAREIDEMKVQLQMNVYGARDHENTLHSTKPIGLRTNLAFLRDNLIKRKIARGVTFYPQYGGTQSGTVYVDDWRVGPSLQNGGMCRAVLSITIPAGYLS